MKYLYTIISIFLFSISTNAQSVDIRNEVHELIYLGPALQPCDASGAPVGSKLPVESGWDFRILNTTSVANQYMIQFVKWDDDNGKDQKLAARNLKYYRDASNNPIYFLMPITYYSSFASTRHKKARFTVAASTTLIKVRPGRKEPKNGANIYSEISNDFNIGALAGFSFTRHRNDVAQLHMLAGLAFTSINLTPYNTNDFLKSESSNGAITPSVAIVGEYESFQFGVMGGLDMVMGEASRHFIYRNRPWIGVGFGFSVFRPHAEDNQDPKSNSGN